MRALLSFLALCLGVIPAAPALAGPWLRAEGETFLAVSLEVSDPDEFYATAYAEYGLRPDLTIGLDLGVEDNGIDKAIAFVLRSLTGPGSDIRLTLGLGLGMRDDKAVIRPGLNIGHGFTLGQRNGWAALELYAWVEPDESDHSEHADLTLGFDLGARNKAMLQVFSNGSPSDGEGLQIGPSLIIEPNPGQHFQIGVLTGLRDGEGTSIKFGIWRSF